MRSACLPLSAQVLSLSALGLLATGCGHVHGHGNGGGYQGPIVVYESEPNDIAPLANPIGAVEVGDEFEIRGHSSAWSGDWYDGFSFYALEPMEVVFDLVIHDPYTDLDVCLYDPFTSQTVACYESPFNPESGSFGVHSPGTEFHLIVSPFSGSADYSFYVSMFPLGYQPLAGEDGGAPLALEARGGPGAGDPALVLEKRALRARVEPYGESPLRTERR